MAKKYISQEDLKTHNTSGDLWISIQNKVYDVSEWSKHHPGGDLPLLTLAGQDVTDAFVAYHPTSAWLYLDRFFTGYHLTGNSVSQVSSDYRKLVAEFSKMGLFETRGHRMMYTLCFLTTLFVTSVSGVLCSDSTWLHLFSGVLMGFFWIQCGWVGHDSGHHQVMKNRTFVHFMQLIVGNCLSGISIAWWKREHNAHHIACNSLDFDPDIQSIPIFAVSNRLFNSLKSQFYDRMMNFNSIARFLVSYQHWTFYPVACFARVNLLAQSHLLLLSKKKKVVNRKQEVIGMLVFWIWYPLLISCLPNWKERVMFVVSSFAVTGIQQVQFALNHFSSSFYVGPPCANDWFRKQTEGTLNIKNSSWMDWFYGGLNFQVEHHLFPRLPRCHLRTISPFVVELCKTHKLPYNSVSFWMANALVIGNLRSVALQARDLSKPISILVWEAVNAHG
ncbi:hypothetical protein Ddye_021048 [Dipteronia dyeriana]|uniref:Cytochrome b5 heme-binding domain-containing protein n=1 Tax=Dipteronia dyeriana TaxID=168575 RepID=A0AAD9U1B7_9ROSI|nr:hypothetical protein Ddye_021048 [Dipteronia dyeriana]